MDGAKYSFDAGGGRVDNANKSSGIGGVCTEDSNVDDKAFCPSATVLDPVSFDHCYVSYQRAAWSLAGSKNGSQGVPRIRKVGLFTHSAEVASKLKQKTVGGDDKTSETAEEVVPCPANNQEEHEAAVAAASATPAAVPEASVPPTSEDAEPEAEPPSPDRLDQAVAEEPSHDGACTSSTADGPEAGGGSHHARSPSSSSSSLAGCCDHGRSGGQAPTINLSGGFIQFRESQSNAPSGSSVLSSFASKPPAPLTPESQVVVGRPSTLLLQSNSVRQASSAAPAGRFLTAVSAVGDLSFGRRLTMGDRCASSAPVLEKYRPASKSSMNNSSRSNFDLDDPDQSVYERIRIALQKSEAMKQQQQQQQQQPQAVVVGSDVAEAESVATEKGGDRTARKRPKSEKGKKRAQSSDSKTDNAQAFATEDYTTRCVCGLKHNDELMIQCDLCLVWQHCMCLQLKSSTIPEKYLCEVCEPRPLPLSMEEARRMQLAKLGKGKSGKKKSSKKAAGDAVKGSSAKADSSDDKDKKKRLNVIRGDVMEYSSEVERLTKDLETSGCLEEVVNKLRPSPPCRVLLVAPRVHGVVVAYTLAPGVPIVECMGYVAQAKGPKGCARPSSLCDRIFVSDFKVTEAKSVDLCLRLPTDDSLLHHLRRSCRPNSSVSVLSDSGKLRFFLISTKQIDRGWEVTIPFDYDFRTSSRHVPCACGSAYDTPRGYKCPVEEFSKQSRRRKGEKIGSGDLGEKKAAEEEEAKSKKRPKRADGAKKPKKGFRVKFFTKFSSRTVVATSGSKPAADQTAASSSSPGDGGDSLIMSKREQRKMQSILTSIQMLEARKEKKARLKSESTSGGEEQLTVSATGDNSKELDDFKTKKKRWLEDQDRMAAVKGDGTPAQEEEQPEVSATEDVSTAKSRNELGVSTLLASAVYLNQCNEKPAAPPAQVEEPVVVPEEGKRKVRKLSIEEYKRLKKPSLDSTLGKNSEEASELRPPLVEKPKPVIMDPFVGSSSVIVDKAVTETVHLPPLDTVMKAAPVDTVAVKVPSCPKAESKGAPVEKKAFEQELEEDDDELMMDRGALVDRLESMRNIFDAHGKEARGAAKDVVYNYGGGGQHPPSDLPAFGSPVARPPPPPPAASFYPHVAASLAGGMFMPNYSVPLSSFGRSLYGSAAPSAAFSYYSRVPPPPTRPMAPPIGGYAGGSSGARQDFMLTHPDMVLTHPDGAPAPLMYMPDHLVSASRTTASVKRSADVCKAANGGDAPSGKS